MSNRRPNSMAVEYRTDIRNVDWKQLKATLHEDNFDNGRTPEELLASFQNSSGTVIAFVADRIVGTARVLSDGVCNAYVVDVWTHSPHRRQGIARTMMKMLEGRLRGQHVYLQTDAAVRFYQKLRYKEQPMGLSKVIGTWLEKGGSHVAKVS